MKAATRVTQLADSYLREILSASGAAGVISLAGGLPAAQCFPLALMQQAFSQVTLEPSLFQYGQSRGHQPLLDFLAQRYTMSSDQALLITSGSQQGLDLLARSFLQPDDTVVVEAPSYLGALQVFRLARANICSVEQLRDGPDVEALAHIFATQPVKMFYTIPDFHNPTGICYSLEVRKKIAALCREYEVLLIEDAPYRELRFSGEPLPLIASLYPEGSVVLRSFSKIACPGLRLGVVQGPVNIINTLLQVKQVCDLQGNAVMQQVLVQLLQQSEFDLHLKQVQLTYRTKYQCLQHAIAKYLTGMARAHPVAGGMFVWLEILSQTPVNTMDLARRALELGVALVPGDVFYCDERRSTHLRINFSHASEDQLEIAIQRLSTALTTAKN